MRVTMHGVHCCRGHCTGLVGHSSRRFSQANGPYSGSHAMQSSCGVRTGWKCLGERWVQGYSVADGVSPRKDCNILLLWLFGRMKFARIYKFIKYENLVETKKMSAVRWKVSEMCDCQKQRRSKAFGKRFPRKRLGGDNGWKGQPEWVNNDRVSMIGGNSRRNLLGLMELSGASNSSNWCYH